MKRTSSNIGRALRTSQPKRNTWEWRMYAKYANERMKFKKNFSRERSHADAYFRQHFLFFSFRTIIIELTIRRKCIWIHLITFENVPKWRKHQKWTILKAMKLSNILWQTIVLHTNDKIVHIFSVTRWNLISQTLFFVHLFRPVPFTSCRYTQQISIFIRWARGTNLRSYSWLLISLWTKIVGKIALKVI